DHTDLAIFDQFGFVHHLGHRFVGAAAQRDEIEQSIAQPRVGDILAAGRADSRAHEAATRRNCRTGRRDCYAKPAGTSAMSRNRKGHDTTRSSGITAVTSTSTTHSGRASAVTTIPVE